MFATKSTDQLSLIRLLPELRRRHWTLMMWGPKDSPDLVASMYSWGTCTDVLILRNEVEATAYRVPSTERVFNPTGGVVWQYHAIPAWTVRAVLSISSPEDDNAPKRIETPAQECFIPEDLPKPVLIRPLSASGG